MRRILAALLAGAPGVGLAASDDEPRPFVAGGIYDKPFLLNVDERAVFGGYLDAQSRHERTEGFKSETTFKLQRLNLFAFASLSDRVRIASEIEFEDGGKEVKIELAVVDFEIHPALTFRGGMLLSPLGRFNLAHDSPANELTDRPLVSTEIIPTTLSEPGMGFLGSFFPSEKSRITYEAYLVNGFDEGIVDGATSIPAGKGNFEDNNAHPSFVSRLTLSPHPVADVGLSIHTGPYNEWETEGLPVGDGVKRDATILAVDWESRWNRFVFLGEYARAHVDVAPQSLNQENQQGFYAEISGKFLEGWIRTLPGSWFRATGRWDFVDFDSDGRGDDRHRLTLGVNFRPVGETVFKLDGWRQWSRDPQRNTEHEAAVLFSVASYF